MTFEQYLRAVTAYFKMGGVPWGQAYVQVLKEHRPDLHTKLMVDELDLSRGEQAFGFIYQLWHGWDE